MLALLRTAPGRFYTLGIWINQILYCLFFIILPHFLEERSLHEQTH